MAYGISVSNSSSTSILDGESPPLYTEVVSGTLSVASGGTQGSVTGTVNVPSQYTNFLVAYQLPAGRDVSCWGGKTIYAEINSSDFSMPFKVFAPLSQVQQSNDQYGLRVYGRQGQLVFDSGKSVFSVNSSYIFQSSQSNSFVANGPPSGWVIFSTGGIKGLLETGNPNQGLFLAQFIKMSGSGSINTRLAPFATGPGPNGDQSLPSTGSILLISIF